MCYTSDVICEQCTNNTVLVSWWIHIRVPFLFLLHTDTEIIITNVEWENQRYQMIFTTKHREILTRNLRHICFGNPQKVPWFSYHFRLIFFFFLFRAIFLVMLFRFIQFVNIDTLFVVAVDAFCLLQSIIKYNKLGLSTFLSFSQALRNNSWCSTINYLNKCSYFRGKQTKNW